MNSKRFLLLFWSMLLGSATLLGQTTYSFNVAVDTAIEANATVIAGYVRADIPPAADDSVQISIVGSLPRSSHMNPQSPYTIYFPAGADSVPFSIQLYDDTFPENPEHVYFQLNAYGAADSIGADNTLLFVLVDNDLPATIGFVIDTGSAYLHDGSFSVCVTVNNPNPFYVRYYTRTYDSAFVTPLGHFTALGGWNYFYTWGTIWAPPGVSTLCQDITIVPNSDTLPDRTLMVVVQNVDDNILTDSTFRFTIHNDNWYYPPSVSFDHTGMIVLKDTTVRIGIPITTYNPNHLAFPFIVDTVGFSSTSTLDSNILAHLYFNGNNYFNHPGGFWHDTVWAFVLDNHLINDTSTIVFRFKGVRQNLSPDTLFYLTMIDTGALVISFKGAGFAHLKLDSIGYVQVYTSGPVKYDITAKVTYLNGDAVMGTDFLWRDTTVTFPANAYDTISLPVTMLRNGVHDGNKQINFLLSDVTPSTPRYDIIQYTYTIIDNDSMAVWPTGLDEPGREAVVQIYPNPFVNAITLHTAASYYYAIYVTDMLGRSVKVIKDVIGDTTLPLSELPQGTYLLRVESVDHSFTSRITKL
ncbi:MAG: T9SS type A sorting domain-containing protein [Bacteroidetes bacterium]|nr:T9SS type A sorting domain-containing protein [Bacteroidota bacterium]